MTEKDRTPVGMPMTLREQMASMMLVQAFSDIQRALEIDHIAFFAVLGQAVGDICAANDVALEAGNEYKTLIEEDDRRKEPYKQILVTNFDIAYNQARSYYATKDKIKPKKGVI